MDQFQIKADQSRSKQIKADQSRSKQIKADQSRSKQIKADQSRSKQIKADQSRSKQIKEFPYLTEVINRTKMTRQIDTIRIQLIRAISELDDFEKLENIAQLVDIVDLRRDDALRTPEAIELKSLPSIESLYAEQGSKPVLYENIPKSTDDWGYSTDELLSAIN